MRILAVSDIEHPALYDHFDKERWANIDLVVSCGDLSAEYLEFLVTTLTVPLLYVRGNHDRQYQLKPPEGCTNIDGRVVSYQRVRFLGLEGSMWYGGLGVEYTEPQMRWKTWKARVRIWLARGVDVIVAHAPPRFCEAPQCETPVGTGKNCIVDPHVECQDADDLPHQGFKAFRELILKYRPAYFLHGHNHPDYYRGRREVQIGKTTVVNCYGYRVLELKPLPIGTPVS